MQNSSVNEEIFQVAIAHGIYNEQKTMVLQKVLLHGEMLRNRTTNQTHSESSSLI